MFDGIHFVLKHPSRVDIDHYTHCAVSGRLLPVYLCDECEFSEGWLDVWELLVSGGGKFYPNLESGMLMCEGAFQRTYILADHFDMEIAERVVVLMHAQAAERDRKEGRVIKKEGNEPNLERHTI
ncbi:hypothetical protein ACFLXQ_01495 [Chloroflexota bacterium]